MSQIFLKQANLSKIAELTDLLEKEGFKSSFKQDTEFHGKFVPNCWTSTDMSVNVCREDYPLSISTEGHKTNDIEDDPHFPLIKKVIQIVECKTDILSGSGKKYDIKLFYK